jgi:hypothetical protein
MRSCDVPGHDNALLTPWQVGLLPAGVVVVDGCATGGGVAFTTSGTISGGSTFPMLLDKPPGSHSSIRFVKAVLWYAARLGGTGQAIHFWSTDYHFDGTQIPGLSIGPPGSENLVTEQQLTPDTRGIQFGLHCGPVPGVQTPDPCVPASGTPLLLRGSEVTLAEDVPPIVPQPAGALLAGGPQAGLRGLAYTASDSQSGIAQVDALLDDVVVASHDLTNRCNKPDFTVCPDSLDETLQIDTRAVPNGAHRLALRVRDAAANERLVTVPAPVEVSNEALRGSTTAGYTLTANFRGSKRSTLAVRYGRGVSIVGRLTGPGGPISTGTRLDVLEQLDRPKAQERTAAQITTTADGGFSYKLPTTRPSRMVRLSYRGSDGSVVLSQPLRLRVRSAATLRASIHGRVIRFSGRLRSLPIPRKGKLLRMEGRAPGSSWTAFRSLRTDREGRFSGRYRLPIRRPGVRLKIRAFVPKERGYLYLSARSKAVSLRVP